MVILSESLLQKLEKAKKQELDTEEHMRIMGVQEKERLGREIRRLNKELDEMRDRCSMYEVRSLPHSVNDQIKNKYRPTYSLSILSDQFIFSRLY